MKKCYNCGKNVTFSDRTCPYCGADLKNFEFCPKCKSRIEGKPDFCSNCGEKLYTICKNCKKKILGKPKFCPSCGAILG
jgi:RNA polymerase subunit RPABC4/transcription elongation factor Spt4